MPDICNRVDILPVGRNRPMTRIKTVKYLVYHETDNEKPGADAKMHRRWLEESRPDASFHICADSTESLQILPFDEICWAIGDGADDADDASMFAIQGEICVNSRAGFRAACDRMAQAFGKLVAWYNLPLSAVRAHGSFWSERNPAVHQGCPRHLKAGDWGITEAEFLVKVAHYAGISPTVVRPMTTPNKVDPGFPGALNAKGEVVLNGVNLGGTSVAVEEVIVRTRNAEGKQYQVKWAGHVVGPWEFRKGVPA